MGERFPELDQLWAEGKLEFRVGDYPPPPSTEEEIERGKAYARGPWPPPPPPWPIWDPEED